MKKLLFLISIIIAGGITFHFTSCKKERVYSCDENLNNYAKKTMSIHQGISRDSLAKIGIDTQFAIINSLSPENNARILKEKIAVLINDRSINNNDKIHLQKLSDYVTGAIYENEHNENDSFLNSWKSYAQSTLGWDARKMDIFLGTWLTETEIQKHFSASSAKPGSTLVNAGLSCNCGGGYLCETVLNKTCGGGCQKTSWGCGFAWYSPCTGRCSI